MKIKKPHLNTSKLKKLTAKLRKPTKRELKFIAPVAVVVVVALSFTAFKVVGSSDNGGNHHDGHNAYEEQLVSQVDNTDGTPRDGRDPANQRQTSLASAASSSMGAGQRTDKPAADVKGDHSHHNSSSDVYGDPNKTGIGVNGCYVDYGIQGQQCVPAHAATNGNLTCDGVRKYFKDGVKITGKDRFHLDKNHDGTACGNGD